MSDYFHKLCDGVGGSIEQEKSFDGSVMDVCVVDSKDAFYNMLNDKTWHKGVVKVREHLPSDTHLYLSYVRNNPGDHYIWFHFAQRKNKTKWETFAFEAKVEDDKIKVDF